MHVTSVTTEAARKPPREPERGREGGEGDGEGRRRGGSARGKVAMTLAVGLVLLGGGVAVALARAPSKVVRIGYPGVRAVNANGVNPVGFTFGAPVICQSGEVLPAGVSAVRLSMWSFFGPPVRVTAYAGSRVLTEGSRAGGWVGDSVTVPVKPIARTASGVRICADMRPNAEPLLILGAKTLPRQAATIQEDGTSLTPGEARPLSGRVTTEYLRSGNGSWFSRIVAVARHAGLGRAFSGTWIAILIVALMVAVGVLAVRLTLREAP